MNRRGEKSRRRRVVLWSMLVSGCILLTLGAKLSAWRDEQVIMYNLGLTAYDAQDFQAASGYFNESIRAYLDAKDRGWLERVLYPQANNLLAAEAMFQKGKCLLRAKRAKEAAGAFQDSVRISSSMSPSVNPRVTLDDAIRANEKNRITQYDLELLFQNSKEAAEQQGKNARKPNQGDEQLPGAVPGAQPGKGSKGAL